MDNVYFVIDHCGVCCISICYIGWRYHLGSTFQEHSLVRSHGNHVCVLLDYVALFLLIGYVYRTIDQVDTTPSFVSFNHRHVVSTQAQLDRKL